MSDQLYVLLDGGVMYQPLYHKVMALGPHDDYIGAGCCKFLRLRLQASCNSEQ